MSSFKERRRQLGMNQTELAEALGISQPTVSRMEAGDLPISRRTDLALDALLSAKGSAPTPSAPAAPAY